MTLMRGKRGFSDTLLYKCLQWLCALAMAMSHMPCAAQDVKDSDKLGMAIDYFQGGKYHEAMLLLSSLESKYKLNPRFKAYLGVCYYYEWEYKKACRELEPVLDKLEALSPQERSVYYFCLAESHFALEEYSLAIPQYERMLNVCHDNEKGDALYRLGFCYMQGEDWHSAYDYLESALLYYERFGCDKGKAQRMEQIKNMMQGCSEKF